MKQLINNESGVSYSIFVIAIVIVYMFAMWLVMGSVVDTFSEQQDKFVLDNKVTEQTQKYYNLSVNLFKSTVLFGLVGVVLWGIRKSKFDRTDDTTSMGPLLGSATLMLALSVVSVFLIFSMGQSLDQILIALGNSGLTDHANIQESSTFLLVDLFYIACVLPAVVGIIIHILTSIEKISYGVRTQQTEFNDYYINE